MQKCSLKLRCQMDTRNDHEIVRFRNKITPILHFIKLYVTPNTMACDGDSLCPIPEEKWSSLLQLFEGPLGLTARVLIRRQIFLKTHFPDFPVTVYAPYGKSEEGIVARWKLIDGIDEHVVVSTKENMTILMEAIRNSKLFDWNTPMHFACTMTNIAKSLKATIDQFNNTYTDYTYIAHLTKEKAENITYEIPNDVELRIVSEEFADLINSVWPHRYPGSDQYFVRTLKRKCALGVFGKETGELRGWIFLSCRGDIHSLHVLSEYRRNGYAQLLIKVMCKTMLIDTEIYSCIITENKASINLFTRLGFELKERAMWFRLNRDKLYKICSN